MLIEEIIRSCVHEEVAKVAVACIGESFASEVKKAAADYGMTTGAFVSMSVSCFARRGDETELRAVQAAISGAQEPILVGLHRILCFMLAAGTVPTTKRLCEPLPRFARRHFEAVAPVARIDYVY